MKAASGPWWKWIGDAIGLSFATAALILAPVIGIAAFRAAVVSGQTIASPLTDHFDLVGLVVRPMKLAQVAGAAFVIVGVLLIQAPKS